MNKVIQKFSVPFEFPVYFTRDLFGPANSIFLEAVIRLEPHKKHRILFVVDENVAAAHPQLPGRIAAYVQSHGSRLELLGEPVLVPGGEGVKNDLAPALNLVEQIHHRKIDRQSFVAVIGGGAVLDMACFAAAISHRGIRALRIPTTVLSQNDSGVGVKNGINLFNKKNFVGTFVPPFAVFNDFDFLATLQPRDVISGISEAVKVGLIRDRAFFEYVEENAERLARGEAEPMERLIRCSAKHHLEHIRTNGDPFEYGSARPLDFGHWAAHKLESMTQNRLRHGEAVAIGMALDTVYSWQAGFLTEDAARRILSLLDRIGFHLWDEALGRPGEDGKPQFLEGLEEFREHLGGELHISLLRSIGESFEVNQIDRQLLLGSLAFLQQNFASQPGSRDLHAPGAWSPTEIRRAFGR